MYRVWKEVDAAETSRDPEDIIVEELGYFDSFDLAKQRVEKYINDLCHPSVFSKLRKRNDGLWSTLQGGSFGAMLLIKEIKICASDQEKVSYKIPSANKESIGGFVVTEKQVNDFLYKPKDNQNLSVEFRDVKGELEILFSCDCGKFGTDEIVDSFELSAKKLLEILQNQDAKNESPRK